MSFNSHEEAVAHAVERLQNAGLRIEFPKSETPNYTFTAGMGSDKVAVQLHSKNSPLSKTTVETFSSYLTSSAGKRFAEGFLLAAGGFSNTALAKVASWGTDSNIRCFELREPLSWVDAELPPLFKNTTRFAVFASKGGVGKSTIAAHFSGGLALHGCNIDLIDIDPQQNLKKLVGECVTVPSPFGVSRIDVSSMQAWQPKPMSARTAFVFDCSPVMEENPREVITGIDAFIVPITLNPIGLGPDGEVIARTIQDIREVNRKGKVFVVANDVDSSLLGSPQGEMLREVMLNCGKILSAADPKIQVFDPGKIAIRSTNLLKNWGVARLRSPEAASAGLAFPMRGRTNRPLNDFMDLTQGVVEGLSKA